MRKLILINLIFILAACTHTHQSNTPHAKSYAEWMGTRKVEVHYERGYKDFLKRYPEELRPIFHKPIKAGG